MSDLLRFSQAVRLSGLTLMPMSERCWWGRAHSSASAVRSPRLA